MKKLKNLQIVASVLVLLVAMLSTYAPKAHAATLNAATVMLYNMQTSGSGQVAVEFKATTTGTASTASIAFGSWGGSVATTQTITSTGCAGAGNLFPSDTALPGTLTASGATNTISISGVGSVTANTTYCAILTSTTAATNPAAGGVYSVTVALGSDSTTAAIDVISNDQYTVSATVAPTFTFSLGGSTDALGTLSATALTTSTGVSASVATNAANGWDVWAMDSKGGLNSTSKTKTINSVTPNSNTTMNGGSLGTEKYALGVTSANATTAYADAGGITGAGLSTSAYNEIATGATGSSTVNLKELADISATTPAATDYTDTITVVGAGAF